MKDFFLWPLLVVVFVCLVKSVIADPQTNLLDRDCSPSISTDLSGYLSNRNKAFKDLRGKLQKNNTKFATAQQYGVYALVQCRDYLSDADCLACFDAAVSLSLNCISDGTARVIFEGCYLRYEAEDFYRVATLLGNTWKCSPNQSSIMATLIDPVVKGLLRDLEVATPKINGLFAAATKRVHGAGTDATIYAVAQCAQTVSQSACRYCLSVANRNVQNCPPRAGGSSVDAGCFLRYSDTAFFPKNALTDIKPFLGVSSRTKSILSACIVGGVCVFFLILALTLWYRLFRKPAKRDDIIGISKLKGPTIYRFKDLKSATRNFSKDSKIGEGGFGDVYKGVTKNGDVVAVKKLYVAASTAKADFESEVKLISNVNHRNIIRLLGYAVRGSQLLLVWEYMANGSLDKFLYGEKRGSLNWKQRVALILGIARGLAYLHELSRLRIVHRDIKSSNILLDNDFQPKIADFGLARLLGQDQSHLSTRFAGTLGYTAPEYAIHGHLSEKVDIYSFGIVTLEIVGGRRCTSLKQEPFSCSLLEHTWNLFKSDVHLDLVDKTLNPNEYDIDNVKEIIEIALMCTQSPSSMRPTMSEVVGLLTNDRSIKQKTPGQPIFF